MSDDLFASVDALLARPKPEDDLPVPAERERLRKLADLTQEDLAKALRARRETIVRWEAGTTEPRPPKREAYIRFLATLALRHGTVDPTAWLRRAREAGLVPAEAQAPAGTGPEPTAAAPVTAPSVLPTPTPTPGAGAGAGAELVTLDQSPAGELVMAEPAACVRCGRPTPFRAGGRPMHGGGWCSPAPVSAATAPAGPVTASTPAATTAPAAPRPVSPPAETRGAAPSRSGVPARARKAAPATAKATKAAKASVVPEWQQAAAARFPAGPLAVVDVAATGKHLAAHLTDGQVMEVPARTLSALTEWTLTAGLGSPRLHQWGRDGDPLVVLTDAAATELGLPPTGTDEKTTYAPRTGRLPDTHRVVKALTKDGWQLTRRGFGPWARVYRTPDGARRECVQYCVPMWGALTSSGWHVPDHLDAVGLLRLLATYADTVITPRGSTAVSGLELMTALRPPTKPVRGESGGWTSAPVPGSLHAAVDAAPPEVPDVHPLAQGRGSGPEEVLTEEAWDWWRPLTDAEAVLPWAVGVDVNTAFLSAAGRLTVGLSEPVHELNPVFDKKLPGSWLVDLSHIDLDERLPSPFTPDGTRPTGPAWYATPTVAYATELGARVQPLEGWLRHESGPYLDPWHDRLTTAYKTAMARLGVPTDLAERDLTAFLQAMAALKDGDPVDLAVLAAVKATAKGGIGKLRERPRGHGYRPGRPWPALERPTWRPDIRAAVIATARVNFHRKLLRTAQLTGRHPIAVLSDCALYPALGPTALDVIPLGPDGRQVPGTLRLGVAPGMVKFEGARPLAEIADLLADDVNPARYIKAGGTAPAHDE
ncbi:hypothetical protein KNE206_65740 [Kitasatospora sp. NE20-6]|uniref:telomere-associated protein Tap n=1 Tax=Kitasatospora sp. NE20-6 TaxID=2859066 RepID=UPI0034DCC366